MRALVLEDEPVMAEVNATVPGVGADDHLIKRFELRELVLPQDALKRGDQA